MANLTDIPRGPHYAIVQTTSVHIPGDERSRTHPGHGYPESTETYITYRAYTRREEWEHEILRLATSPYAGPFRALVVEPADVTVSVNTTTIKMPNRLH